MLKNHLQEKLKPFSWEQTNSGKQKKTTTIKLNRKILIKLKEK